MIEPQPSNRIVAALGRAGRRVAAGARRAGAYVRAHPLKTAAMLPAALVLYVAALYPFTPSIGDIRKAKLEQPTVVLSADGKELAVFKRANRDWVKLTDISPNVVNALLATEDHRFYSHPGFDVKRTVRALLNTLQGDREGGSTITQQLARNLYPEEVGRAPTVTRKVKELITAFKIEAVYTKNEILETYLNTVPFLYNAYGIEMAARTYFDKSAEKLDMLESATLVGMLKGTSYYNPVLNPDRAMQRRNTVLAQMVKHKKLPAEQFERLAKRPLKVDFERQPEFDGLAPHLAQNLKRWLIDWADRNDYNIYADGLVVRTTIDSRLQQYANQAVQRQGEVLQRVADRELAGYWTKDRLTAFLRETPAFKAALAEGLSEQAALDKLRADTELVAQLKRTKTRIEAGFLAIDPLSGHVKAWVGSRDYQVDKFDHVAQARRQPGSTFKPFVYAAAFEAGARPSDTYVDQEVEIVVDKNKVWRPTDMHGSTGQPMTLREGLVRSKNTITAQVAQQVGVWRVAQTAKTLGIRQSPLEQVPSLALGVSPVTLREVVSAYGTIANGGSYIAPTVVTTVEDRNRNILEVVQAPAPERALSTEVAQTLVDVMRGVIDEGTAVGMRGRFGIAADVDLAGKTGTTQNNTDGWFVAMHPQLVAGAWMGFNDNRVSLRSEYWGQGAHNALFVVGDFLSQSLKTKAIDAKMKFSVPKGSSKEAPAGFWDPLVGRVNDWWNNMFPGSSPENGTAAVAQPKPMPAPPTVKIEPMPDTGALAEPLRLPDSGALPQASGGRTPETVLGAPPPRMPDATIPAPASQPPVYGPEVARSTPLAAPPLPGGRRNVPQSMPDTYTPTTPAPALSPSETRESITVRRVEPAEPATPRRVEPAPATSGATGSIGSYRFRPPQGSSGGSAAGTTSTDASISSSSTPGSTSSSTSSSSSSSSPSTPSSPSTGMSSATGSANAPVTADE
jgi:penicillin-binding protein 1A